MDQSETIPWKEPLLLLVGASCYLKIPSNVKQQFPGLRNQNPTHSIKKVGDSIELTYRWKIDENNNVIEDEQLEVQK
jgi:hypothetical protein